MNKAPSSFSANSPAYPAPSLNSVALEMALRHLIQALHRLKKCTIRQHTLKNMQFHDSAYATGIVRAPETVLTRSAWGRAEKWHATVPGICTAVIFRRPKGDG